MDTSNPQNISTKTDSHARTIIHIDMDCFYAQVEEIRDPSLRSKPLGIQQKSIVVTSNYVARDYGVKKLMLISEAKKLCPHLILVNGEDLTNYRQMSNKIFEVLHKYTPLVEKLGLDENFIDVTHMVGKRLSGKSQPKIDMPGCIYPANKTLDDCECGCAKRLEIGAAIAKEMRHDLNKTLGITCCAGISYNKLLAKLVGSQNKPNNQTVLVSRYAEEFMRDLNYLNKITGIGQKTESSLLENGIANIIDLQNCDMGMLKTKLGAETAIKLNDISFGRDATLVRPSGKPKTIGLEDSCRPISVRKDVEERFRLLLMRLVNQVAEDGRLPIAIKIILRKFDATKKTSHRETKQANIMASLFKQTPEGQIIVADEGQETLLKLVMRLFERIVDMNKPFNITLLGLAFSKFQERKSGTSSIANFLMKKTDLEVQSVTCLTNDHRLPTSPQTFSPGDQFYRRRTTASPIPMHVDIDSVSVSSDVSDFSENEIEPSPKKFRMTSLIAKRRCLSHGDSNDIASPSKLRVSELRLNSRDSDKDFSMRTSPATTPTTPIPANCDMMGQFGAIFPTNNPNNCILQNTENPIKPTTMITGNLANIPCPSGVDSSVFNELPLDVQNELISSWKSSIASKTNGNASPSVATTNGTTSPTATSSAGSTNTLYRYFIRN